MSKVKVELKVGLELLDLFENMIGAMVGSSEVREIFVQFIVGEGIHSSLPFGMDVVPKSRKSI